MRKLKIQNTGTNHRQKLVTKFALFKFFTPAIHSLLVSMMKNDLNGNNTEHIQN